MAVSASESLQQRGGDWTDKAQLAANRRFSATEMLPELTVGSDGSHGALKATVSLNGREYSSETGLAVRPGWPLTSMVGGGSAGEGTTDFELPDSWYPGTGALSVTISGAPVVDALSLLETVDTWGFGLDRAVSHGWITLCLPSLLSDEDKDLTNPIENRIALNTVLAQTSTARGAPGAATAPIPGARSQRCTSSLLSRSPASSSRTVWKSAISGCAATWLSRCLRTAPICPRR